MKRKLISIILVIALCAGLAVTAAAETRTHTVYLEGTSDPIISITNVTNVVEENVNDGFDWMSFVLIYANAPATVTLLEDTHPNFFGQLFRVILPENMDQSKRQDVVLDPGGSILMAPEEDWIWPVFDEDEYEDPIVDIPPSVPGGSSVVLEAGSYLAGPWENLFIIVRDSGTPPPTTGVAAPFDNPHSDWAREELIRAFEEDLIPLSLIGPNVDLRSPITRAEFAGVAVKTYENLAGETIQPAGNNPFADTWDADVLRAYNAGIMVGVSATQFDPNTTLNREQAATALTRVFKRWHFEGWSFAADANFPLQFDRPTPFADDAAISYWARESVYFMNANGIILGLGNNIFGPRAVTPDEQARGYAQATREQAILIALRMVENLG